MEEWIWSEGAKVRVHVRVRVRVRLRVRVRVRVHLRLRLRARAHLRLRLRAIFPGFVSVLASVACPIGSVVSYAVYSSSPQPAWYFGHKKVVQSVVAKHRVASPRRDVWMPAVRAARLRKAGRDDAAS